MLGPARTISFVSWPTPTPGADGRAVRRVPARVGLVGNPSDLHGGAVLAVPIPELVATVEAQTDPSVAGPIELIGSGVVMRWADLDELRSEVANRGHPPGVGIITASFLRCLGHLHIGEGPAGSWRIGWTSDIPRSVGLAGSSALAVGVIDACAAAMGRRLPPVVVAALALAVEAEDLGIVAGWQDRIVQAIGAPVLVDAARMRIVDGLRVPAVEQLAWPNELELLIAWRPETAEESGTSHARAGSAPDEVLVPAMEQLATTARRGARALVAGEIAGLERAVRRTWSTRSAVVPLRPDHAALVELVASTGLAATTPGSGGSVVALVPDVPVADVPVADVPGSDVPGSDGAGADPVRRSAVIAALDGSGTPWMWSRPGRTAR